jgi:osmotically-inducible protein OsmY
VTKHAAILCFALALGVGGSTVAAGCATRAVSTTTGDDLLKARIETALASAADVNADAITVDTSRGVVTLTGQVTSGTEQQSVGAIVRAIPGVEDVRFSLTIAPPAQGAPP